MCLFQLNSTFVHDLPQGHGSDFLSFCNLYTYIAFTNIAFCRCSKQNQYCSLSHMPFLIWNIDFAYLCI